MSLLKLGLLTFEANTASQASNILKDVLKRYVRPLSIAIDTNQTYDGRSQESVEGSALKSMCAVFKDALSTGDEIPNEHFLSVISILFLELGMRLPTINVAYFMGEFLSILIVNIW